MSELPTFDNADMKNYLRQQIGQENVQKAVLELRSKAKIEIKVSDSNQPAPK